MTRIYFDNAATTVLEPGVVDAMIPYITTEFGNPSSIHSYGRDARIAVEKARKTVAEILNVEPGNIVFTSCGTESNNAAILSAIRDLGCRHIITSPIEHHAVLNTINYYGLHSDVKWSFVKLLADGHVDLSDLEKRLGNIVGRSLVSLMHANNEVGNMLDLEAVAKLCKKGNAVFHSDCVQSVGHYPLNIGDLGIDFITASGHKFHGPKGVGILYVRNKEKFKPLLIGGAQEKNMRAGTENVAGIIGFAKALQLSMSRYEKERKFIEGLKVYLKAQLLNNIPAVDFNGDAGKESLYTVLNVSLPVSNHKSSDLLLHLDQQGICISGGSACSGGQGGASHVIEAIYKHNRRTAFRFSFCRYNTKEQVDKVIEVLKKYMAKETQKASVEANRIV